MELNLSIGICGVLQLLCLMTSASGNKQHAPRFKIADFARRRSVKDGVLVSMHNDKSIGLKVDRKVLPPGLALQLKTVFKTNDGLVMAPTTGVNTSGSSNYAPSPTTRIPVTFKASSTSMASTTAGQGVSCTPDFSTTPMNGQCVTVDDLDQQCGASFEAAQSTKDCEAFAGSWCCYVPSLQTNSYSSASSTSRPSLTMPSSTQTTTPLAMTSYTTPVNTMTSSAFSVRSSTRTGTPGTTTNTMTSGSTATSYSTAPTTLSTGSEFESAYNQKPIHAMMSKTGIAANRLSASANDIPVSPFSHAALTSEDSFQEVGSRS